MLEIFCVEIPTQTVQWRKWKTKVEENRFPGYVLVEWWWQMRLVCRTEHTKRNRLCWLARKPPKPTPLLKKKSAKSWFQWDKPFKNLTSMRKLAIQFGLLTELVDYTGKITEIDNNKVKWLFRYSEMIQLLKQSESNCRIIIKVS